MARLVFVALHMLVVEQLVVALPGAAPHIDEEPPSLPSIDVKRPVPTLEGQPKPPTKVDPDMLAEIKSKLKAMPPPGIKPKIPQIPKDFDIADLKEKLKDLTAPKPSIDDLRNVKARSSSRGSGLLGRGSGSGSAPAKPQLEYDLAKFIEVYVPGWGSEAPNTARGMPDDKPIHNPEHPDFDPFEIPMPTLKQEWDPKAAFEAMDKDGDGKVRGSEFRAISESGMCYICRFSILRS
eukprot:SAG31_NODE_50_length_30520_cov_89.906712_14_plen_236_part_00